jgi:hypothetical protein
MLTLKGPSLARDAQIVLDYGLNLPQEFILKAINKPRSDEEIIQIYNGFKFAPRLSDSGIRTNRSELVKMGVLEDSGETTMTQYNRKARIWQRAV